MQTNFYGIRRDIRALTTATFDNGPVVLIRFVDESFIVYHGNAMFHSQVLFDLLADKKREVGNVYLSMIDGKYYTEWFERPEGLYLDVVIGDNGSLCALADLPKEEFGGD